MTKSLTYLSFGAGVQSTAMLVMSTLGDHRVARADVAIFADTGDEPQYVYDHIRWMEEWMEHAGDYIPIVKVGAGHLSKNIIARHQGRKVSAPAIPAFTLGERGKATMLQRHCTRDYKVRPIQREARRRLGRGRGTTAIAMIGISTDEVSRVKDSTTPWIKNTYPLIDANLSRDDCLHYLKKRGIRMPGKSSCVFCPYHSDEYWTKLKREHPADFQRAVELDVAFRDMTLSGVENPVFLHKSLRPLSEVPFGDEKDLFGNECEGVCGV